MPTVGKSAPMIHIIGLGVTDHAALSDEAAAALVSSQLVIGSARQLAVVEHYLNDTDNAYFSSHGKNSHKEHADRSAGDSENTKRQIQELPPLRQLSELLENSTANNITLLASGDPLYYGIGRWFSKRYAAEQLRFYPGISSIQAACHSIGLSLQDAQVISLHGRPLQTLRRYLAKHRYLVILTDQHSHPVALAEECVAAGLSQSKLWVCEQLGYPEQQVREFTAQALVEQFVEQNAAERLELVDQHGTSSSSSSSSSLVFDPLHVTIIEINRDSASATDSSAKPNKNYLPSFPGIPDEHFITDNEAGKGLITKREVRLAILSLLQPAPDDIGWDIGAGCGGVTVEWALWNPLGSVHAIEHHPKRLDCLQQNRDRFGVVDNLHIVAGRAPQALSELPAANKIFIGGSDGELPNMLQTLWQSLPLNGVIVASAVMETSRMQLLQFSQSPEFSESGRLETLQIAVSKGGELAGQLLYRPNLPVTLFKFTKTAGAASRHSD